ncbi:hypothetical protein INT48_001667, partial [Thamnidium elegans]
MSNNVWNFDNHLPGGSMYASTAEDIIQNMETRMQQEIESLNIQHASWMHQSELRTQSLIQQMRNECMDEIKRLKQENMKESMIWQSNFHDKLREIEIDHSKEVHSLQASYDNQISINREKEIQLNTEIQRVGQLTNRVEELQQTHDEYLKYKSKTIEEGRLPGAKYAESLERIQDFQVEIAKLTTDIDKRSAWKFIVICCVFCYAGGGSVISDRNWDEQLLSGNITNPRLQLAQQLIEAEQGGPAINSNSGRVEALNNVSGYSKNKYPLKQFDGSGTPTTFQWLSHFEKVASYHEWNDAMKLKGFQMALFGDADLWLAGLDATEKRSYEKILESFKQQYGGDDDKMSYAIHTLEKIKQGTERMQLHYFNRAVHPSVYEAVRPSRPSSLAQAINYALQLERNFQMPISNGGKKNSFGDKADNIGAWKPQASVAIPDDPMEDVQQNAQ